MIVVQRQMNQYICRSAREVSEQPRLRLYSPLCIQAVVDVVQPTQQCTAVCVMHLPFETMCARVSKSRCMGHK